MLTHIHRDISTHSSGHYVAIDGTSPGLESCSLSTQSAFLPQGAVLTPVSAEIPVLKFSPQGTSVLLPIKNQPMRIEWSVFLFICLLLVFKTGFLFAALVVLELAL